LKTTLQISTKLPPEIPTAIMSKANLSSSIQRIIHGMVEAYNIKSDGDTEYLLAEMVQTILDEVGYAITSKLN